MKCNLKHPLWTGNGEKKISSLSSGTSCLHFTLSLCKLYIMKDHPVSDCSSEPAGPYEALNQSRLAFERTCFGFVYLRYAFLHIQCNSNPSCLLQSVYFLYACVCDTRDILHIRKKQCLCTLVREYISLPSYIWINVGLTSVLYKLMRK